MIGALDGARYHPTESGFEEMADADLPALICARYRPLRVIGKGGMGVVYEVEHIHTGQHLALKVLTQQPGASVERFKREARAASSIQSDHIVRVTDADIAPELGGAPFLVMELLEGADLERVTGDKPVPPPEVLLWLRQVARALDKAHAGGIVHRDLKPANLFLTRREDGSPLVKILDFGIAKMAAESTLLTNSDSFLGTPGFMAPEQTDSKGPPVTYRADLYTLGLIAFKLLTGQSYWRNGSLAQLLAQILVTQMPPPSERGSSLGPAFDAWFLRACDRDVNRRFASTTEQVEALAVALGLPEQAQFAESGPRTVASASVPAASPSSLNGSFRDVKGTRTRIIRRRWLAMGAVGTVAAAIVSTFLRAAGHGEGPMRAAADGAGEPVERASVAVPPSRVAPTVAPAPLSGGSPDAEAPSLSAAAATLTARPAESAVRHRTATPGAATGMAGAKPAASSDAVWGER